MAIIFLRSVLDPLLDNNENRDKKDLQQWWMFRIRWICDNGRQLFTTLRQ